MKKLKKIKDLVYISSDVFKMPCYQIHCACLNVNFLVYPVVLAFIFYYDSTDKSRNLLTGGQDDMCDLRHA